MARGIDLSGEGIVTASSLPKPPLPTEEDLSRAMEDMGTREVRPGAGRDAALRHMVGRLWALSDAQFEAALGVLEGSVDFLLRPKPGSPRPSLPAAFNETLQTVKKPAA